MSPQGTGLLIRRLCAVGREEVVGKLGPRLAGPVAEVGVGEADAGEAGYGVHPQEAARLAEVAERPGRVVRAGPVRRLAVPDLEAQAPVVVRLAAEAGQHPGQAGKRRL